MNVSVMVKAMLVGGLLWATSTAFALLPGPSTVRVTPYYSTAYVRWSTVSDPSVAGYEIYRRTASGSYGAPVKRVLQRVDFSDYNLTPGETYYYKAVAIDGAGNEVSEHSAETATTLLADSDGLSMHKVFDLLIVIYTGGFSEAEVTALRSGIRRGMLFYYRTTCGVFAFDPTYMIIDSVPPGDSWYSSAVQNDLRARGVENDQYDLGFMVGNGLAGCYGGYVVFGSMCGALGHVCGVPYPEEPSTYLNTTVIWTFTHEIHHALEAMENRTSGTPEVIFCHFSDAYPNAVGANVGWTVDMGPHFEGIAATNRDYGDKWFLYPAPYDGYIECVDTDGDGFPDNDRRLLETERTYRTNAALVDSDDDGLDDLSEFCFYNFAELDADNPDTDGDGVADGNDVQPLYDVSTGIAYMDAPTIDGVLEPSWPLLARGFYYTQSDPAPEIEVYGGWNEDGLYFAVSSSIRMMARISIDGSAADGRWESDVRHVDGDPDTRYNSNDVNNIGDVWDDGRHLVASPYDPDLRVAGVGDVPDSQVSNMPGGLGYVLEIRVPRALPGGSTHVWYPLDAPVVDGLRLSSGREIGVNMVLADISTTLSEGLYDGERTELFETHSMVDLPLLAPPSLGDMNCDGVVDTYDIDPFVLALSDQAAYEAAYPACDYDLADMNGDGIVDTYDIDGFVGVLAP